MTAPVAEIRLPTKTLHDDLPFYQSLGFRLETIFPADDPSVAVISGHGLRVRLERGAPEPGGTICILTDDPGFAGGETALVAPSGVRVEIAPRAERTDPPRTRHAFVVRRLADQAPWVIGRAGMNYRDLIPDRLGGAIIASHIRIEGGGPVPDVVHYHTVGFQLIFCHAGWVDLVYEDQGPPFRLRAGDCVIQPPEIRHRVLEASANVEVVEIGVPAEHVTTIDHEMELPTPRHRPDRVFGGQVFRLDREAEATWEDARLPGFTSRDTGVGAATRGVAGVTVVRPKAKGASVAASHDADILFSFVRAGGMTLEAGGREARTLAPGDAFVIPPGMTARYGAASEDLELLEVALRADFGTAVDD